MQRWWVNQTRLHRIERNENNNVVAGEINVDKREQTHWGRRNVEDMKGGDFIACYRSGIGIDQFAYVKRDGKEDPIPWEKDEKRKAFVAKVEYMPIKSPVPKKEFWDDLIDIASGDHEPIDLIRNQIRYAYAMKVQENAFDKIIDLAERRNPGKVKKWLQERGYNK